MKKLLLFSILLPATVLVGAWGLQRLRPQAKPDWTTTSHRALEELQEGLDDVMRLYIPDAEEHFARALELDPGFAIAKLYRALYLPAKDRRPLIEELRTIPRQTLNERETFLIDYHLALFDRQLEVANEILTTYHGAHPDDPFALNIRCSIFNELESRQEAEACFREMTERHPNWVRAHNLLGYIAMAAGRMDEAEERFRTYRFIAPDQANPNDSLGELLALRGRYGEAEEALHEALLLKPDFCDSSYKLLRIALLEGREHQVAEILRGLARQEACRNYIAGRGLDCYAGMLEGVRTGDPEAVWSAATAGDCVERQGGYHPLQHRAAVLTGRRQEAEGLRRMIEENLRPDDPMGNFLGTWYAFAMGIEAWYDGRLKEAAEWFEKTDGNLSYKSLEEGEFKLFNRLHLVHVLEELGRGEAADWRHEIESVNPSYPRRLPDLDAFSPGGT